VAHSTHPVRLLDQARVGPGTGIAAPLIQRPA
jgi:hypothetical protein